MEYDRQSWQRAVDFHGHACPGLAQGFRVSQAARRILGLEGRAEDEELIAIVENDACGVDAVQVLTGCTLGKGNLIFRNYGKSVFTFARRDRDQAVRIYFHGGQQPPDREYLQLRRRVEEGSASAEEESHYRELHRLRIEKLLTQPEEELLSWQMVQLELPGRARLFNSLPCSRCGEKVSEGRARVRDGKPVCIPCAGSYSRGW